MSRSKTVFQFHPFPTPATSSITPCRHPIPIDSLPPPYMPSRIYIFLSLILLVVIVCLKLIFPRYSFIFFHIADDLYEVKRIFIYQKRVYSTIAFNPLVWKKTRLHYVSSNDLWAWCPADRQWFDVIDRVSAMTTTTLYGFQSLDRFENEYNSAPLAARTKSNNTYR